MKRKKINKLIALFVLGITILGFKPITTLADTIFSPFKISESSIVYYDKEYEGKPKILLYSSHSQEEYLGGEFTVIDAQKDMKSKLEKLGYIVDITENDFTGRDYNNSYNESLKWLKGKDLKQYSLIIDLHRDSRASYNKPTIIDGLEVSKCRFVYSNSHIDNNRKELGDKILEDTKDVGIGEDSISYNSGIFGRELALTDHSFLIEIGTEQDSQWSVKRSITYITNSIDNYFKNNSKIN